MFGLLLRLPPPQRIRGRLRLRAKTPTATDKSGGFILSGVPASRYSICVQDDAGNAHIDPCQWSSNPVVVKIAAGESVSSVAVPVIAGTTLQVRIEDPRKLASPRM